MTFALLALRYLWPFLLLGAVYLWADRGWCNHACAVQKSAASTLHEQVAEMDRARIRQQERWAQVTAAEELRAKGQDERQKRIAAMAARARGDAVSRSVSVPDSARRMLGDAYAAAIAAEAAESSHEAAPANSATVAETTAWGIDMLAWATVCRDTVTGWQSWYLNLTKE